VRAGRAGGAGRAGWATILPGLLLFSAGLALAQRAPRVDPNVERAQIHYRLGWESLRSEKWESAVKEFQQAIELNPRFALAHCGLGRAFLGLRRYPDAARAYET